MIRFLKKVNLSVCCAFVLVGCVSGCGSSSNDQITDFCGVELFGSMPKAERTAVSPQLGKGAVVKLSRKMFGCDECCVFPQVANGGKIGVIRFKSPEQMDRLVSEICKMAPDQYMLLPLPELGALPKGKWIRMGKGDLTKPQNIRNVFVLQQSSDGVSIFATDFNAGDLGLAAVFSKDQTQFVR